MTDVYGHLLITVVAHEILPLPKWLLHLFTSPVPQPLATTDLFPVAIVLPLPGHHVVGITQQVAFPEWLPSLKSYASKMNLLEDLVALPRLG